MIKILITVTTFLCLILLSFTHFFTNNVNLTALISDFCIFYGTILILGGFFVTKKKSNNKYSGDQINYRALYFMIGLSLVAYPLLLIAIGWFNIYDGKYRLNNVLFDIQEYYIENNTYPENFTELYSDSFNNKIKTYGMEYKSNSENVTLHFGYTTTLYSCEIDKKKKIGTDYKDESLFNHHCYRVPRGY